MPAAPMVEGRAARAEVPLRDLYHRSLALPLLQSAVNLALYAALAWAAASSVWCFALWPAMGFVLSGFLAAAHDCLHGTFVNTKRGNRIAGAAWCVPILVDFTLYKYPHLTHHRYTRQPGDSEEWVVVHSFGGYVREMFAHNPFSGAVKAILAAVGRLPAYIDTDSKRRAARMDGVLVVLWLLAMGALTVVFPRVLVAVYWAPYLFFNSMVRLSALPEHAGCGEGPDVRRSTRSVISNALVRTVLWNGNFHAEHHLHPAVPSCNLAELSRRLGDEHMQRVRSYLGFHLHLLRVIHAQASSANRQAKTGHDHEPK